MKYRVTCLTPTLVGDGQRLAPIDYMVWKDHVNVLAQNRIFKLLARGPRLEGYLQQLKKAEKLDFASWGGFAQNYSDRRIPFEHSSAVPVWEKAQPQQLFIPTFATNASGAYLPATAIKGALRTGSVFDRWSTNTMRDLASKAESEGRLYRSMVTRAEEAVLGGAGNNLMRRLAASDSSTVSHAGMKVYLLRTATLIDRGGKFELGWKSMRGTSDAKHIDEATPTFAEMAAPGMAFEGGWREQSARDRERTFQAANKYAASQIARHKEFAQTTGLAPLTATLNTLEARLKDAQARRDACLLTVGWGGGMVSKVAVEDTSDEGYRSIVRGISLYQRALRTGLPFPKTRRVVFESGKAAQIPGWVLLEVA